MKYMTRRLWILLGAAAAFVCLASLARAADDWIPLYRVALAIDAGQTAAIRKSQGVWTEMNPLYRSSGSGEAVLSLLAVGYGVERLIVALPEPWRGRVGWLATAIEAGTVGRNWGLGVRIRF